jgi:subtilisin family serine protease
VAPVAAAAERPNPYAPVAPAASAPASAAPVNPYSTMPTGPSSTLSVLALVFGIIGLVLSLFSFGFLPALAGVIMGHIALKREPHARGMAIGGLATGYAGLALSILIGIVILAFAFLPFVFIGANGGFGG